LEKQNIDNARLKFIDIARSFAIIFMLEGHFITLTYDNYFEVNEAINEFGTSGNLLLDFWYGLRGFTAPLFFTITGLVLGYLLMAHKGEPFWKQKRVSKGWRRGLRIIFWGYLLQFNVKYFLESGKVGDFIYTFHVLQCIGTGLLLLIVLYGIHHLLKRIKFSLILFIAGVTVFALYPIFTSFKGLPVPENAPIFIQNMIYKHSAGSGAVFAIFPNLGYIFIGASLGALFRDYSQYIKKVWFPLVFVAGSLLIIFLINSSTVFLANTFHTKYEFIGGLWLYDRVSVIVIFIGILMYAELFIKVKGKFFRAIQRGFIGMGQNTLNIYIVHCILLYGSIFGWGIKSVFNKNPDKGIPLSFGEAAIGAILFILFFAIITYYRVQIKNSLLYIPRMIFPNLMQN
jgi:uncharacterized membrane protein